ncbi:MAG TPA: hypothetical protein VGX68_25365 [Thermoanaerobaculia bacterium]|jgi:hypothetical protein|nr:hypothetical protein [Thermoanaerobaculia bacterium]
MDRRILSFAALALGFTCGLWGQTITHSPLNPKPGDVVTFAVTIAACVNDLEGAVTPPDGNSDGVVRLTLTEACACVATPIPVTVGQEVGPLTRGTYDIELFHQYRAGGDVCCEGGCSPPELLSTSALTVAPTTSGPDLFLRQGRFHVRANWNAPGFGQGTAQAVQLTDESGYFTFFDPNNVELIVKVLQGCPVNQRYWVFMAGLTNVGVTIFVEDTLTGHQETYDNPVGRPFQPILDTGRFATCP